MRPTKTKSEVLHKCQLLLLSFLYRGFRYPVMTFPLILNCFLPLFAFQDIAIVFFVGAAQTLFSLLFFLCFLYFFIQRGMLRISWLHPILFSKAEGWSDANSAIFIPQSNRGNVKLTVGTAAFYDFFFFKAKLFYNLTSWSWDKQAFQSHRTQNRTWISDSSAAV